MLGFYFLHSRTLCVDLGENCQLVPEKRRKCKMVTIRHSNGGGGSVWTDQQTFEGHPIRKSHVVKCA